MKKNLISDDLFEKRPKSFGVGGALPPKRDQRRFVRWAKYVRFQRQKRFLYQSRKAPYAVGRFSRSLDKNHETLLFSLLRKYKRNGKNKQKRRHIKEAEYLDTNYKATGRPKILVKLGINHVTNLIENKLAALVLIARDVDPIETVCWLPSLCDKMGVPFAIVKSKARLGLIVGNKKVATLAIQGVDPNIENMLACCETSIKADVVSKPNSRENRLHEIDTKVVREIRNQIPGTT